MSGDGAGQGVTMERVPGDEAWVAAGDPHAPLRLCAPAPHPPARLNLG